MAKRKRIRFLRMRCLPPPEGEVSPPFGGDGEGKTYGEIPAWSSHEENQDGVLPLRIPTDLGVGFVTMY